MSHKLWRYKIPQAVILALMTSFGVNDATNDVMSELHGQITSKKLEKASLHKTVVFWRHADGKYYH